MRRSKLSLTLLFGAMAIPASNANAADFYTVQMRLATPRPQEIFVVASSAPMMVTGITGALCVTAQPPNTAKLPTGNQAILLCNRHGRAPERGQAFSGKAAWTANQQWTRTTNLGLGKFGALPTTSKRWATPIYEIVTEAQE